MTKKMMFLKNFIMSYTSNSVYGSFYKDHTLYQRRDDDWLMFWAIETRDAGKLNMLCKTLKSRNKDICMYFDMKYWDDIFTKDEMRYIKTPLCGMMDFSPIQHANVLGWTDGMIILCQHNIGCNVMGNCLPIFDLSRFKKTHNV